MPLVTPGTFSSAALASELNTDPLGIGYAASITAGQWQGAADKLNTSPEPIAAGNQETIYRSRLANSEFMGGIVAAEYTALTQGNRDLLALALAPSFVKTGDANVRTLLGAIFAAGTTSRTNLNNLAQKSASRAEALFGDGFAVTAEQVAVALGHA